MYWAVSGLGTGSFWRAQCVKQAREIGSTKASPQALTICFEIRNVVGLSLACLIIHHYVVPILKNAYLHSLYRAFFFGPFLAY